MVHVVVQRQWAGVTLVYSALREILPRGTQSTSIPLGAIQSRDESSYFIEQLKNSLIQNTNYPSRQLENNKTL